MITSPADAPHAEIDICRGNFHARSARLREPNDGLQSNADSPIRNFFWVAALLLGGFQFWISRMAMNTDGNLRPQDMADAIARGNWGAAVNACWRYRFIPVSSLWAGLSFRPSPYREFGVRAFDQFLYIPWGGGRF